MYRRIGVHGSWLGLCSLQALFRELAFGPESNPKGSVLKLDLEGALANDGESWLFWTILPLAGKMMRYACRRPGLGPHVMLCAQVMWGLLFSAKECYTFYVLRLKCSLGMVLLAYTWALEDSLLALEGCAGSSGRRLVDREPKQSTSGP
ncbi:hypothetical protein B296_00028809 [Ensete ventricosum]|uniref:Uncharacterized protein n=1 Tax=Ensete ventricosum TaxID=4639 RepID=A0A426YJ48_ENSVE|nr:hypothetical protein B296_00028809 [Ensete ventricosum]